MDTNRSPGFPPESNRVLVAEGLSRIRPSEEPDKQRSNLETLGVLGLLKHESLRSVSLRFIGAVLISLVLVVASVLWWSGQAETLNESTIPTVTALSQDAQPVADLPGGVLGLV